MKLVSRKHFILQYWEFKALVDKIMKNNLFCFLWQLSYIVISLPWEPCDKAWEENIDEQKQIHIQTVLLLSS